MDPDLIASLCERYSCPIVYGVSDCAPFACDHLKEVTGDDLMKGWHVYSTREERDELLEQFGGLHRIVLREMRDREGWTRVEPSECQYPGLGLVNAGGWTMALCVGNGWWMTKTTSGVALVQDAARAWQWG